MTVIYAINANDCVFLPVIKSSFNLSDNDVFKMINESFSSLKGQLLKKGISYDDLKRALIPNQRKDRNEVCFIFDSTLINSDFYGSEIFNEILPLMDKVSTYSVLAGDYVDIIGSSDTQTQLCNALSDVITKCNDSEYCHSSQFFLIYINSITNSQLYSITKELERIKWFYGYAILNTTSFF